MTGALGLRSGPRSPEADPKPGQPGDIIVDLAGQPVPSMAALQSVLAAHTPGDRVQARVSRDGAESTVLVTLGSLTG
jgi:S1-C subfamily serine protease